MLYNDVNKTKDKATLNNLRLIRKRTIIIPLVTAVIVFFSLGKIVIDEVNDHYYVHVEEISSNLAVGYANSISKSIIAEEKINVLLEKELLSATMTTGLYIDVSSNDDLVEVARSLDVDEINIYNKDGQLIFTTMPGISDWQTYPGHPLFDFLRSDERSFVEDIRANAVTGNLYKYGYFKLDNGNVVQIGLNANNIRELLVEVEISNSLNELLSNNDIVFAMFINTDYVISYSSDIEYINRVIDDQKTIELLSKNEKVGGVFNEGSNIYEMYVPIMAENQRMGTLYVGHSMQSQREAIQGVVYLGIFVLLVMFSLIAYVILSNFNNNKKLSRLAYYDSLTGLPNAKLLQHVFSEDLDLKKNKHALVLVNVSEFKHVNMTQGYDIGDQVLVAIAHRLKKHTCDSAQLFRFDGDRFVFVVKQEKHNQDFTKIAQKICEVFKEPVVLEDFSKVFHCEIGVVKMQDSSLVLSEYIKRALIAINIETENNGCLCRVFDDAIYKMYERQSDIIVELQEIIEGIDQERLTLAYQPQLCLNGNTICGIEALARLNSKKYGEISPTEFIELAERNHLIFDLGEIIFEKACQFSKVLSDFGYNKLRVAINVSGKQIIDERLVDVFSSIAKKYNIEDTSLEIEITETTLMSDIDNIKSILGNLKKHGFMISLDDFGTGYSSFYRLSEFPIDILKIDKSFVQQISNRSTEKLITSEIIKMAHKYDLAVVAEGVENEDEYNYLKLHDCDIIQGYFFSKPTSEEEVLKLLEKMNNE